jgi:hypothetical protein
VRHGRYGAGTGGGQRAGRVGVPCGGGEGVAGGEAGRQHAAERVAGADRVDRVHVARGSGSAG